MLCLAPPSLEQVRSNQSDRHTCTHFLYINVPVTHSSLSFCSKCPNHLSLLCLILYATRSTDRCLFSSSLDVLFLKLTSIWPSFASRSLHTTHVIYLHWPSFITISVPFALHSAHKLYTPSLSLSGKHPCGLWMLGSEQLAELCLGTFHSLARYFFSSTSCSNLPIISLRYGFAIFLRIFRHIPVSCRNPLPAICSGLPYTCLLQC